MEKPLTNRRTLKNEKERFSIKNPELSTELKDHLQEGVVIPAHPLALTPKRTLDENRQSALTRYYIAPGAGGVAVGVHTTQFEIRDPEIQLLEAVLKLASDEIDRANLKYPFVKIAGICGPTVQALREAECASDHGYHIGLLSMGGLMNGRSLNL